MIVVKLSKKEEEIMDKIKHGLYGVLHEIAVEYGIESDFVNDSKTIQYSVENIMERFRFFVNHVKINKEMMKLLKEYEVMKKKLKEKWEK